VGLLTPPPISEIVLIVIDDTIQHGQADIDQMFEYSLVVIDAMDKNADGA
jgi:hypothetical protein